MFETDQGTLQLISQMTKPGARRLLAFLEKCEALRAGHPAISQTFTAIDFAGRDDIIDMKLERKVGKDRKILSTIRLRNGALWRRGQLRMPGIKLPSTVMMSIKGRLIEEIVEGAPFAGFEVTGGVQDGGTPGNLRLRCTAERTGPIAVDIDAASDIDLEMLHQAVAERLGSTPVEPFAAYVLTTLSQEEALVTLMRLSETAPGKGDEPVSLRYEQLLDGFIRPKHLKNDGAPNSQTDPYAYDIGEIRLKLVKAGIQAICWVARQGSTITCLIEKGEIHFDHPEGDPPSVRDALGFNLPGLTLGAKQIWTYGGLRGRRMLPDTTVARALCL